MAVGRDALSFGSGLHLPEGAFRHIVRNGKNMETIVGCHSLYLSLVGSRMISLCGPGS